MTEIEKKKLENYDDVVETLKERVQTNSEICNYYIGKDDKITIKRLIIAYAKMLAYKRILYQLTKDIE